MNFSFYWKNHTTGKTINKEINISKKVAVGAAITATVVAIGGTIALAIMASQGK